MAGGEQAVALAAEGPGLLAQALEEEHQEPPPGVLELLGAQGQAVGTDPDGELAVGGPDVLAGLGRQARRQRQDEQAGGLAEIDPGLHLDRAGEAQVLDQRRRAVQVAGDLVEVQRLQRVVDRRVLGRVERLLAQLRQGLARAGPREADPGALGTVLDLHRRPRHVAVVLLGALPRQPQLERALDGIGGREAGQRGSQLAGLRRARRRPRSRRGRRAGQAGGQGGGGQTEQQPEGADTSWSHLHRARLGRSICRLVLIASRRGAPARGARRAAPPAPRRTAGKAGGGSAQRRRLSPSGMPARLVPLLR